MANDNYIHKQLESLHTSLRDVSDNTKDIRDKVSDTREEVVKIGVHVNNHEKDIKNVKGRVTKLENKMSNAAGWIAGISATVSTFFMVMAQFYKKFFG